MGAAAAKTQRILSTEQDHRILMVGLDNAGKTTILYRIKLSQVVTTIPTIGFQVETVEYKNFSFTVFDCGGQDKIRPLWRHYFKATNGLIWVIDSNDRNRLIESKNELHLLMFNEPDLQKTIPLLIFAHKQDLKDCININQMFQILFDFNIEKYPIIINKKVYQGFDGDSYDESITNIIRSHFLSNDNIDINIEICQLIIDFIPLYGIFGKFGERDFAILPTTAMDIDTIAGQNLVKGLEYMDIILNPNKKECLIM